MLIYARQRRYRHLISPTRHGCTTHSEFTSLIGYEIDIIDTLRFNNDADFLYRLATALKIRPNHEYWCKCTWQTSGINITATSDRLDLRWQLGFQWHRRGIELVLQVPRLFHNATVSQWTIFCCYICTCICCLKLHQHSAPMYLLFYYLCRILISRPPRVFRRFKRRSCSSFENK